MLRQFNIWSEVVGLDYLGFTSLHGTPLRPPWKRQHCPLLITGYCSCAPVCSSFQSPEVCVYYPWSQHNDDDWAWNVFTGEWSCCPFYILAENMQVGKEWVGVGVGKDQFHVWHCPTQFLPFFLASFNIMVQTNTAHPTATLWITCWFHDFICGPSGSEWISGIFNHKKSRFWWS